MSGPTEAMSREVWFALARTGTHVRATARTQGTLLLGGVEARGDGRGREGVTVFGALRGLASTALGGRVGVPRAADSMGSASVATTFVGVGSAVVSALSACTRVREPESISTGRVIVGSSAGVWGPESMSGVSKTTIGSFAGDGGLESTGDFATSAGSFAGVSRALDASSALLRSASQAPHAKPINARTPTPFHAYGAIRNPSGLVPHHLHSPRTSG